MGGAILPDQRLRGHHRLHASDQFRQVFKNTEVRVAHPKYILLAKCNSVDYARLGIVVGKRHINKASARNVIKRLVRETFRKNIWSESFDVLFLVRSDLTGISKKELTELLEDGWKRLKNKCSKFGKVSG
tara:strand:- start:120 stop:509 length:390 start_codon:yes stop_codon:yes gene_type:complete